MSDLTEIVESDTVFLSSLSSESGEIPEEEGDDYDLSSVQLGVGIRDVTGFVLGAEINSNTKEGDTYHSYNAGAFIEDGKGLTLTGEVIHTDNLNDDTFITKSASGELTAKSGGEIIVKTGITSIKPDIEPEVERSSDGLRFDGYAATVGVGVSYEGTAFTDLDIVGAVTGMAQWSKGLNTYHFGGAAEYDVANLDTEVEAGVTREIPFLGDVSLSASYDGDSSQVYLGKSFDLN